MRIYLIGFVKILQQRKNAYVRKKKILIVDDEKELIALVSLHMRVADHEVLFAYDGGRSHCNRKAINKFTKSSQSFKDFVT
ncbi:MAG: hypothetical protein NC828_03335 [Candidatus Omnitrophica bacterium]|nr:hypothetical protein [Candidatus Omnitrophota bacterium]